MSLKFESNSTFTIIKRACSYCLLVSLNITNQSFVHIYNDAETNKKKYISSLSISPLSIIEELNTLIHSRAFQSISRMQKSCTQVAIEYLSGLIKCEKGHKNME